MEVNFALQCDAPYRALVKINNKVLNWVAEFRLCQGSWYPPGVTGRVSEGKGKGQDFPELRYPLVPLYTPPVFTKSALLQAITGF